jgi:transcriptional regulator with XRE-family HTH domain
VEDSTYIGLQVRALRKRLGMSQQGLADRVGIDRTYIAHIEAGRKPVDRRELLYSLASALSASVADLTGQPYEPLDQVEVQARATIAKIEHALMAEGTEVFPGGPRPLSDLEEAADRALLLRMRGDYVKLGRLVPNVISDLHVHLDQGTDGAAAALTKVTFATAMGMKELGLTPLAWNAATAARSAARQSGDPVGLAAAEFVRSQVLLATAATGRATAAATDAINALQDSSQDALEIAGMLHLQASLCRTALARQQHGDGEHLAAAGDHYREAEQLAARTGEGTAYQLRFGPTNVKVWGLSLAVERDESDHVPRLAASINQNEVDTPNRLARYFIERGRAHARTRQPEKALQMLLRAEQAAPHHVRTRPVVRELVGFMLRDARRKLATGPLSDFAVRVGATPT